MVHLARCSVKGNDILSMIDVEEARRSRREVKKGLRRPIKITNGS
jgi:hypothetical protein